MDFWGDGFRVKVNWTCETESSVELRCVLPSTVKVPRKATKIPCGRVAVGVEWSTGTSTFAASAAGTTSTGPRTAAAAGSPASFRLRLFATVASKPS